MLSPDQPVFPFKHEWASGPESSSGIDLRTWMATQIMAAGSCDTRVHDTPEVRAKDAIDWADALITELNKPKP